MHNQSCDIFEIPYLPEMMVTSTGMFNAMVAGA
jgi:hypothetical protein